MDQEVAVSTPPLDFAMAVVDGVFLKPFVRALSSMDVSTFFFVVTRDGISLNQPNELNGRLFISWNARAEDFIFFDYYTSAESVEVTVMANDFEKALKSVQKKKSVSLLKYADQKQLKVSISETITKPDRHHFPNSISVPIQSLVHPNVELGVNENDENFPIVAAEASHVCEEFQRIVLKHDDKKGSLKNLEIKVNIREDGILGFDPVEEEDGFRIGIPSGPLIATMGLPLHLFREVKKLAASTPEFSLIKFYFDEERRLKLKCKTGNYGTLRLYYSHE